jgi:hypothetical protein
MGKLQRLKVGDLGRRTLLYSNECASVKLANPVTTLFALFAPASRLGR